MTSCVVLVFVPKSHIKRNQSTSHQICTISRNSIDIKELIITINTIKIAIKCFFVTKLKMVKLSLIITIVSLLVLLGIHSVWSTEKINNNKASEEELLNQFEYCVLNDSAIRKKDSDDFLTIINDTEGWLIVTNGSDLFIFPSNGSNCEDDSYNPDIVVYAIQTSVFIIVILVAICIIGLHLYFKELQTVFGILIILFCFFYIVDNVIAFCHDRYQFTHEGSSGAVCAVFLYIRGILNFLLQFTRLTILFQFTYLMYSTYRVRSERFDTDNKLILKYFIFIISMTTIYSILVIVFDLAGTRSAFSKDNGYCTTNFHIGDTSFLLLIIQLASVFVMQVAVFAIGMVLYSFNKGCCEFRSIDARVCLTLGSTTGLDTFLILVVILIDADSGIAFLSGSIGTAVQMFILLILFLTSKKVKIAISPHNST